MSERPPSPALSKRSRQSSAASDLLVYSGRKRLALDIGNTAQFISNLDLGKLHSSIKALDESEVTPFTIEESIKSALLNARALNFSSAHLWTECPKSLSCKLTIESKEMLSKCFPQAPELLEKSNEFKSAALRAIDYKKEAGSRMLANLPILVAVNIAQISIDNDVDLSNTLSQRHSVSALDTPLIAVIPECSVPQVDIGGWVFHGTFDWALGIVDKSCDIALSTGSQELDVQDAACAVIEAKSRKAFDGGRKQVIAQLAALAVLRKCDVFVGALTDGFRWNFHLVGQKEGKWFDYAMGQLLIEKDEVLIIQMIAFMIIATPEQLREVFKR